LALGKPCVAGHGEWDMAEARKGSALGILAIHTLTGYLLRFKRASRSTQGPRSCDASKLHPSECCAAEPDRPNTTRLESGSDGTVQRIV
jgi:hypothetical protein